LFFATFPLQKQFQWIVFDNQVGYFWIGHKAPNMTNSTEISKKHARLQEIHALQIISEYCDSSSSDSSPYYSYELNLIFHNGQRINVVDHAKLHKLREDATDLAEFLRKPVWDATR
jgi:hypothetical protein